MRSKCGLRELPESMQRSPRLTRRTKAVVSSDKTYQVDSVLSAQKASPSNETTMMPLLTERCNAIDSQFTDDGELLLRSSSRGNVAVTDGRLNWIRAAWMMHFALAFSVLGVGIQYNQQSRKYIPIFPPSRIDSDCDRVFLNVMASSETDEGSILCCKTDELLESVGIIEALTSICPSEVCSICC